MPAILTVLNPARRRAKARRRGNPASLVIVNGRRSERRNAMAARSRSRTRTRRSSSRHRVNPKRRAAGLKAARTRARSRTVRANHRRSRLNPRRRYHARTRRSNPRVRRNRHRRNPGLLGSAGGLLENAVTAIIGMGITNFAYGFVGGMNPAGMMGQIGIKLGIAIGLRMAANKFGFAKHANMLAVGGAVSAGQDALNYFVGGGGALFPSPVAAVPGRAAFSADVGMTSDGMQDIVYGNPANFMDVAYSNPALYY